MVHITNGSVVAGALRRFDSSSPVLAWNDVLHEGPVPEGLTFAQMNLVRAEYLAAQNQGAVGEILQDLQAREALLMSSQEFLLWFEDDLYDQLQVIQILDWFHKNSNASLGLVWIPQGVHPEQLGAFMAARRTVRKQMLEAAAEAWQAFCSPTPKLLLRVLKTSVSAIPHLPAALTRFLQEYPARSNGLSRTERQILQELAVAPLTPLQLFAASQAREESAYMGDSTFWGYLDRMGSMLEGYEPGVLDHKIAVSGLGLDVLAGKLDRVRHLGIDRWLGGVHLRGKSTQWRWDERAKTIIATPN